MKKKKRKSPKSIVVLWEKNVLETDKKILIFFSCKIMSG